jgi:hypothetical protein
MVGATRLHDESLVSVSIGKRGGRGKPRGVLSRWRGSEAYRSDEHDRGSTATVELA